MEDPINYLTEMLSLEVTVRTFAPAAVDAYGNDITSFTDVTVLGYLETTYSPVDGKGEATEARQADTAGLLVLPAGTAVTSADRIIVLGDEWAIEGHPAKVWDPLERAVSHIEARVRRVGVAA